jgi:hypothetical protein
MLPRGVSIALDDPGASSAGSGDCAFAHDIGNAAMLPASAKDTIKVRIMGFLEGPQLTNVPFEQLVPSRRPQRQICDLAPPAMRCDEARRRLEKFGLTRCSICSVHRLARGGRTNCAVDRFPPAAASRRARSGPADDVRVINIEQTWVATAA